MQEKLAYIKSKCIQSSLEIMDVVFGCRLKDKQDIEWIFLHSFTKKNGSTWYFVWNATHGIGQGKDCEFEILGRDINIGHILIALDNYYEKYEQKSSIALRPGGSFIGLYGEEGGELNWSSLEANFDLTKTLDEQSEVTINSLYQLLGGK